MNSTSEKETSKGKNIANTIVNVVLWIFMAFAFVMMIFAFASISNDYGVPVVGKKVILNVKSNSMDPTIKKDDMIVGTVLSDEEKETLDVGDIITFFVDLDGDGVKEINTHRIVSKNTDFGGIALRTRGDNKTLYPSGVVDDGYTIRADDVICTWKEGNTQIHGLGAFLSFTQSKTGFLVVVLLPLIALFAYEVIRLVFIIMKIKGKDKRELSDAEKEEIRRLAIEEYRRALAENAAIDEQVGQSKPAEPVVESAGDAKPAEPTDEAKPEE